MHYYTHQVLIVICHLVNLCHPQLLTAPVLMDLCQSYSLVICQEAALHRSKDLLEDLGCHDREEIDEVAGGERVLIFSKNRILLYCNSQNLSNMQT